MSKELEVLSSEQAQDLALLEAAANDQPLLPGQEPEQAPVDPVEALSDEIGGIILAVVGVLSPVLPGLVRIYTPEKTKAAAGALAAVCAKRGWLSGGLMGDYAEEFVALMVLGPMAVQTYMAIKADVAALKIIGKAKEAAKVAPPKVEGQSVVIAGPAVVPEVAPGASVAFGQAVPA